MNYFNYFTEIEDTFVRRRGKHLFLSPLDWALIEMWQERGIPMHIVIRAIESVFDVYDQQPPGTRSIKTLFYCREEVEVGYAEWLRSQVGGDDASEDEGEPQFSLESVKDHIAKGLASLASVKISAIAEDVGRTVTRLEEVARNLTTNFETIDKTLGDIERVLERAIVANWDADQLKVLKKEVAGQLREYRKDMTPEAYQNTFDLMLLKRLREEAGIPRLGLFYL